MRGSDSSLPVSPSSVAFVGGFPQAGSYVRFAPCPAGTWLWGDQVRMGRRTNAAILGEKARSPRFLGSPCVRATFFDPGGPADMT